MALVTTGSKGFLLKVGRNNIENDKLTSSARSNDLWIHAKDYHSSHAILEHNGQQAPEEVIKISCEICAKSSKSCTKEIRDWCKEISSKISKSITKTFRKGIS